jgi:hypothetical protein
MKINLSLARDFGPQLGDGGRAAEYRAERIDPFVSASDEITLDFTGVRSANSSFINALIASVVEHNGERVLSKIIFKGCNATLQVLVEAAIDLGVQKGLERAAA